MRIAVLSDIHGNLPALEAVLDDAPQVDMHVCLGDIVGYNPWPADCVDRIREVADATVTGNHERRLIAGYESYRVNRPAYEGLELADEQLTTEQREWIADLPEVETVSSPAGEVVLVHSHPDPAIRWKREGYVYPRDFTQMGAFLDEDDAALLMGHTHVQHAVDMSEYDGGSELIVNPGSVGQPRDEDPRAAYAIIDLDAGQVDERRVEYDIGSVQEEIRRHGLPEKTAARLSAGE